MSELWRGLMTEGREVLILFQISAVVSQLIQLLENRTICIPIKGWDNIMSALFLTSSQKESKGPCPQWESTSMSQIGFCLLLLFHCIILLLFLFLLFLRISQDLWTPSRLSKPPEKITQILIFPFISVEMETLGRTP